MNLIPIYRIQIHLVIWFSRCFVFLQNLESALIFWILFTTKQELWLINTLVLVELQKFMYDLGVGGLVLVGYVAGQWGNFLPSALVHVWIV